jgi:hypothetical protein
LRQDSKKGKGKEKEREKEGRDKKERGQSVYYSSKRENLP